MFVKIQSVTNVRNNIYLPKKLTNERIYYVYPVIMVGYIPEERTEYSYDKIM